ncbi:YpjP family protein [Virgibacillus xinjiangensis]|uniref:YpjP family protein n=1 Tax=Virgibacillus xinjiangensis TaxID=393090 RepID=A0ABV7CX91_9BACI
MKPWVRKALVAMITVMTLGMYTPPVHLTAEAENEGSETDARQDAERGQAAADTREELDVTLELNDQDYLQTLTEKAKEKTLHKLGPRIVPQVEDEFTSVILPKMTDVLEGLVTDQGGGIAVPYYSITEEPSPGVGERIFNIHDDREGKDIAKFHVRRDNRPLEGYWFNFHYHLSQDGFEQHHDIGEIYWDKNMPPKWMA